MAKTPESTSKPWRSDSATQQKQSSLMIHQATHQKESDEDRSGLQERVFLQPLPKLFCLEIRIRAKGDAFMLCAPNAAALHRNSLSAEPQRCLPSNSLHTSQRSCRSSKKTKSSS